MATFFFNYAAPVLIICLCLVAILYPKMRKFRAQDSQEPGKAPKIQDDPRESESGNWEPNWVKDWSD